MVQNRHRRIADEMVYQLEGVTQSCLAAASRLFEVPQWSALAAGEARHKGIQLRPNGRVVRKKIRSGGCGGGTRQ